MSNHIPYKSMDVIIIHAPVLVEGVPSERHLSVLFVSI